MRIVTSLIEALVPQRCLLCSAALPGISVDGAPLCRVCADGLRPIGAPGCERCGIPLLSEQGLCLRCRERDFAFERSVAVFEYDGAVVDLIHAYKFGGSRLLGRPFGRLLYRAWHHWWPMLPIVPVPANPKSRAQRGWDQTLDLLAAMRRCGPVPAFTVLRRRRSQSQKQLNREQRLLNLRDTLSVRRGARLAPAVVLLDDVFTTGATLHECARVLRQHGVERVVGLTLAID